jgi:DNA-binding MarR family transcriptional regulator
VDDTWSIDTLSEELLSIFPALRSHIAAHLRSTGDEETTLMQASVLNRLKEHSVTASEIAKLRRVSLQSASVLVQSLVERGWIIRAPDPSDRRQFLLQITPEGVAKADTTHKQFVSYLSELFAEFTEEEIAAAQIFLPALRRILTQHSTLENTQDEKRPSITTQEEQGSL